MKQLESLMWAILERCGRLANGFRTDVDHPVVATMIDVGVLKPRKDGLVAITDKGRAVLKMMPARKPGRPLKVPEPKSPGFPRGSSRRAARASR
jgi:hypothetical protein